MTAYDIFSQFRQRAIHSRDLGDKFERFFKKYLLTDPQYADRFAQVWLWMEFPYRNGKVDTGIDIVAQEKHTGDFWAIQCKFFDENSTLSKNDIDSFLSASGKKFEVAGKLVQYSQRMIVSTTDNWGKNAEEAIANQTIPVLRLRLEDLANAPIDWEKFSIDAPEVLTTTKKNTLRPHQKGALAQVLEGFSHADRGKLVMACGTGKTFTSLKIAEEITKGRGTILFLVPSISLLSQSLREWTSQVSSGIDFHAICVCSDTAASRKTNEDMSVVDLALPATTDPEEIRRQYQGYTIGDSHPLIVVFSTYQSITKVAEAQKLQAFGEFDLIICDEAHRTTGITLADNDESSFVKVHDNDFIKSKKRLYMTATPRIYSESSKNKAAEAEATLCSMDDETTFGNEFHRLGFGEAVGLGLLSDYKVLVLAVDEKYIHRTFQKQITDDDDELKLDDAVKIVGCWNGLSKRFIQSDEPEQADIDKVPMKRAVAFCNTIKASKTITRLFTSLINDYQQEHGIDQNLVSCEVQHVDGTYNSLVRNERIDWLKAPVSENSCKILSNARCLAEGVDVPALDAVMFLNPRNSVVDVVQSVGRVMRKAENKNYGYIILPVGIPTGEDPTEALNNNKKYKIVWDVLQALRSHDDRFNSTINKIELNKRKPPQISVVGIGSDSDDEGNDGKKPPKQIEMNFPNLEEWKDAIYARIVAKCGDRRYWEKWGQDVANIAKRVFERINILIERDGEHKAAFREFLKGLRTTINPSVSEDEAIEMLAQHNITKPIFEALFENYSFTTNNPVSVAMEKIQNLLNKAAIDKETESLEKFYDSVRLRASKIDNGVGRQKVIVELYDKFFRSAFPRTVEKLGIVYTPVEVVDFIIHSVSDVLQKEFSLTLSDENIHILDGFTGTGTFITRLLQSGLIDQNSLQRKYQNEIYANEIVLLAYYIAAINIENVFHDLTQNNEYVPFEGICLTDTFQLGEEKRSLDKAFPENSRRIQRQQAAPIRVIIGNPPYSVGQRSANDNAQNQSYKILEERINETYAAESNANNKNSLYDSYIKAFRWATDKIGDNNGVIGFVSNGSWIEGNATDGFRKCLEREFSSIYIFNLRGNQRTSGELSRKEGGKIFGSGSRAPIAITLLVRNQGWNHPNQKATIYYHDIGDYLTREQKLSIIKERNSINTLPLKKLHSNEAGDWLNHRDDVFSTFIPLGNKHDPKEQSFFYPIYSRGAETGKDSWLYNFSNAEIKSNVERMINAYNNEIDRKLKDPSLDNPMIWDSKKIQWSSSLLNDWRRGKPITLEKERIIKSIYRPYVKECLYWGEGLVHRRAQLDSFFPKVSSENYVICVSGIGSNKPFSSLIVNTIPCLDMVEKSQCFPLYYYTENKNDYSLFAEEINGYIRHDALTDFILERAQRSYGSTVSKEDIFYYVYGILHSNEYRQRFESDLKKMLPRIPFVDSAKDFWAFSKAGRELANLHLEYENYASPENVEVVGVKSDNFIVQKMKFPAKNDKSSIIYNRHITIKNIPPKVYDYVVNGKSAVEWIMERYQITTDKKSKIKNDPNDWSKEHDNPRYILDLLLSVMTVSLETMEIVKSLPKLKFEETAVDSDKTEIIVSTIGENSN